MGQSSGTPNDSKRFLAVAGHTRLFRRGAVYYFRAKVPSELINFLNKKEIRKSLKTTDFQKAKKLCNVESVKADSVLNAARNQLAANKRATEPLPAPTIEPLSDGDIFNLVAGWLIEQEGAAERWAAVELPSYSRADRETAFDTIAGDLMELADPLNNPGGARATKILTDAFIKASPTLTVPEGSPEYQRLSEAFRKAKVEALHRNLCRLQSETVKPNDQTFAGLFAHSSPPKPKKQIITLKALTERFMDHQRKTRSDSTPVTYSIPIKALLEVLGEAKRIEEITNQDILAVGETFQRMPAHITQRYPKLSILKAIARADAEGNNDRFSAQTVSKYFNNVCAIFNYAVDEGMLETSPAKGKRLRERFRVKVRAKRELFKPDELKAIFNAPLYRGCVDDENNYAKPGPKKPRRARFWVPLLGLFQGARLNEVCQLYCEDVKTRDGVNFLSIRTELDDGESTDKTLKTQASVREVPVHPELEKMGFLAFVNARRKDGSSARLFPELRLGKSSNRYSSIVSRWFSRFVTNACGHKPKAVFHSLRHHFRTALSHAGIGIEIADELCGWVDERRGMERRYLHVSLKQLSEAIGRISYDGLDLSHLHLD